MRNGNERVLARNEERVGDRNNGRSAGRNNDRSAVELSPPENGVFTVDWLKRDPEVTAFLQRALLKGWTVTVTGSSRTREYTDQQTNTRRFVTEVHADNVQVGGPVQNLNQATNTAREPMPPPASSARVLTHPAARNNAAVPHGIPAGYVPQVVDSPASIPMDAEPLYADYGPPLQQF